MACAAILHLPRSNGLQADAPSPSDTRLNITKSTFETRSINFGPASERETAMTGESPPSSLHSVLVYIPGQRGSYLASEVLRSGGFDVSNAASRTELEHALKLVPCGVVVTVTSAIGEVRTLSNLPVVNIQAFVLPNHDPATSDQSALFDRAAFLDRVRRNLGSADAAPRWSPAP